MGGYMPRWASPERQAQLVNLWAEYGNECLLGHKNCYELAHYVRQLPIKMPYPHIIVKPVICRDRNENILRYPDGTPMMTESYSHKDWYVKGYESIRLYELKEREVIQDWIREDRQARAYLNRVMSRSLHLLPEIGSLRGSFSAISRDIYHDSQPQYFVEALGISGVTLRPFAKIRIASSYTRLHVDISQPLKEVSKHRKRKFIRYQKPLPVAVEVNIQELCNLAISKYLSK